MSQQWFLCNINQCSANEEEHLKSVDNLSVKHSQFQDLRGWLVWLPIIPRVGDALNFPGWHVRVSRVTLFTNTASPTGLFSSEAELVAASIHIRDDVVVKSFDSDLAMNMTSSSWENYARRGNDLQYYAWELRHASYFVEKRDATSSYKRWHSRIRPVAGDIILVEDRRWRVSGVELASAHELVDGWLDLEP